MHNLVSKLKELLCVEQGVVAVVIFEIKKWGFMTNLRPFDPNDVYFELTTIYQTNVG